IRWCNPYSETFFGRPASELVGRDPAEFAAAPIDDELALEIYEALRAGRTWEGEFSIRHRDGSIVTAHVVDSPLHDDSGQLVGIASMSLDVTARRRAENRLLAQYEIARTLGPRTPWRTRAASCSGSCAMCSGGRSARCGASTSNVRCCAASRPGAH